MKPIHLPITGHDLLAVERFQDDTRHMAEYLALTTGPLGESGQYIRRFLTEDGYTQAQDAQRRGHIRIIKHAVVIEGHILPDKPKKRRK